MSEDKKRNDYENLPIILDKKLGVPIWSDVRELKLKYKMPLGKIKGFFTALSEEKILATRCPKCERTFFPPQVDCPYCRINDLDWIEVPKEGILETYTIITIKPTTFQHYEDYVLAIASFENNVKILTWLKIDDKDKIKIGMKVKLTVSKRLPEGYYIYELTP